MSEGNLLVFGVVVTFIAVAGAYVYFREAFQAHEEENEPAQRASEGVG